MKMKYLMIIALLAILTVGAVSANDEMANDTEIGDFEVDDVISTEEGENSAHIGGDYDTEDPSDLPDLFETVDIYDYIDIKNPDSKICEICDPDRVFGVVIISVDGKECFNKEYNVYDYQLTITAGDVNLTGFGWGRYHMKVTYDWSIDDEKYVNFVDKGDVRFPEMMAKGENTGLIITGDAAFSGTVNLYNAVINGYDAYVKDSLFASAQITKGYGRISFENLSLGNHAFCLEYTFGNYSYPEGIDIGLGLGNSLFVNVLENDEGFASGIIDEDPITVKLTGPVSDGPVSIYVDGKLFKTSGLNNGTVTESIPGLSLGEHYITIQYASGRFYSNTFHVIVSEKTLTPAAPATVKLSLKKVKVKKSAKRLVLSAALKINGKPVKNQKLKFKFAKKSYSAKTNKRGVAKVIIKKKTLKKLKAGKKITYQVSYSGKSVKRTVKVKK